MKNRHAWVNTVILIGFLVAGFTNTMRTDTPATGDSPTEADDRMREIKAGLQERLVVDHYWAASASNTYDAADTGKHSQVTFQAGQTVSSVDPDEGVLFTKDVSAIAELFWRDESENEKQLTLAGGLINIEETDIAAILLDEDAMTSDSATSIASQQSIKAYVDTKEDTLVTQATSSIFGASTLLDTVAGTLAKTNVYLAQCDGLPVCLALFGGS